MAESEKHLELVTRIVEYVRKTYYGGYSMAVLHDLPGAIGCDKPPFIGSFRPDVYAVDAPLTTVLVGEAKTQVDLETDHTHQQLAMFCRYLALQKRAVFVLAVPWQAKARGRTLLEIAARQENCQHLQLVVIDELLQSIIQ
jgi:hypothetical protein